MKHSFDLLLFQLIKSVSCCSVSTRLVGIKKHSAASVWEQECGKENTIRRVLTVDFAFSLGKYENANGVIMNEQ